MIIVKKSPEDLNLKSLLPESYVEQEPRQYTAEEIKEELMDHVNQMIWYWDTQVPAEYTPRQRLEGLAFSIFTALDGCAATPGFILVPDCHPSDPEYLKSEGMNWYPCQHKKMDHIEGHLGGYMLHENLKREGFEKDQERLEKIMLAIDKL